MAKKLANTLIIIVIVNELLVNASFLAGLCGLEKCQSSEKGQHL